MYKKKNVMIIFNLYKVKYFKFFKIMFINLGTDLSINYYYYYFNDILITTIHFNLHIIKSQV